MYLDKTRRVLGYLLGSHSTAQDQRRLIIKHHFPLPAIGTVPEKANLSRTQCTHIVCRGKYNERLSTTQWHSHGQCRFLSRLSLFHKTCKYIFQFLFLKRFQQIVECGLTNSLYHIFVVSSIKDDSHIPRNIIPNLLQ